MVQQKAKKFAKGEYDSFERVLLATLKDKTAIDQRLPYWHCESNYFFQ